MSTVASPVSSTVGTSMTCVASGATTIEKLQELQLLESYVRYMALDIPMLNAAKSEREWDWFFHKLEEGFLVADVSSDQMKRKLARRFMRGRQLAVWCQLSSEAAKQITKGVSAEGNADTTSTGGEGSTDQGHTKPATYESIRDEMYRKFFPHSEYFDSLLELYSGHREVESEAPRRKMSLVGVKSVIGIAKETMQRVAVRYGRDMPPESYWLDFAERLMTPGVKEVFDSQKHQMADAMPIEEMLSLIKDPNARNLRAPHKFRKGARRNNKKKITTTTTANSSTTNNEN